MRMKPDDRRSSVVHECRQFIEFEKRDTKLGMNTGCPDMFVMPPALPRVDAHEYFFAGEEFGPVLERVQIVERDPDAFRERPFIFRTRSEIRRE